MMFPVSLSSLICPEMCFGRTPSVKFHGDQHDTDQSIAPWIIFWCSEDWCHICLFQSLGTFHVHHNFSKVTEWPCYQFPQQVGCDLCGPMGFSGQNLKQSLTQPSSIACCSLLALFLSTEERDNLLKKAKKPLGAPVLSVCCHYIISYIFFAQSFSTDIVVEALLVALNILCKSQLHLSFRFPAVTSIY